MTAPTRKSAARPARVVGMPRLRLIKLEIVGQENVSKRKITIDGRNISKKDAEKLIEGYYFKNGKLMIEFNWNGELINIDVRNFK